MPFSFPTLSVIDLGIIIFYLVANALIGFITFRKKKQKETDSEEFILAGRTLTLPAFVATLVSTWYGGIISVGEYAYDKGIVMWIVFGIPYYVAALIYAFVLAHRVNNDRANSTISDRLRNSYGERVGYLGSFVAFLMTSPAGYIMILGTLYQWYFGLDPILGIAIAIISSVIYLFKGGFRASVRADMLQFILMFAGFFIIIPYSFSTFGGVSFIKQHVPEGHLNPFGSFSLWYIVVWYILALSTLVDPNVNTRVFAAKSRSVAKWGMIVSVFFWLIFDIMTNVAGLYARAAFSELPQSAFAYPALAEKVLPVGLKGVFYTGMLATVLSTVDSFFFTSATIVGRDILWRIKGNGNEDLITRYTRIGLFVTAIVSVLVIAVSDKIYNIWYSMGSILVPVILLPLTLSYFPKLKPSRKAIEISMIGTAVITTAIYILGMLNAQDGNPIYLWGIEPVYAGLAFSLLIIGFGRLFRFESGPGYATQEP